MCKIKYQIYWVPFLLCLSLPVSRDKYIEIRFIKMFHIIISKISCAVHRGILESVNRTHMIHVLSYKTKLPWLNITVNIIFNTQSKNISKLICFCIIARYFTATQYPSYCYMSCLGDKGDSPWVDLIKKAEGMLVDELNLQIQTTQMEWLFTTT